MGQERRDGTSRDMGTALPGCSGVGTCGVVAGGIAHTVGAGEASRELGSARPRSPCYCSCCSEPRGPSQSCAAPGAGGGGARGQVHRGASTAAVPDPERCQGRRSWRGPRGGGGTRFPPAAAPLSDFPRRREAGQARGTPGAVVPGPAQLAHGGAAHGEGGRPLPPPRPPRAHLGMLALPPGPPGFPHGRPRILLLLLALVLLGLLFPLRAGDRRTVTPPAPGPRTPGACSRLRSCLLRGSLAPMGAMGTRGTLHQPRFACTSPVPPGGPGWDPPRLPVPLGGLKG